jgi:hypothetical protein
MSKDLYKKYQIEIDTNNNVVSTEQFVKVVNRLLKEMEELKSQIYYLNYQEGGN